MLPDTGHRSRSGGCGRFRHRERCTARAHRPRGIPRMTLTVGPPSSAKVNTAAHRVQEKRLAGNHPGWGDGDVDHEALVSADLGRGRLRRHKTRDGFQPLWSAPTPCYRRRARCRRGSPTPGYVARHRGDEHDRQRIGGSSRPPERRAVDLRPTRRHRVGEGRKECRRKALLSGRDGLGTNGDTWRPGSSFGWHTLFGFGHGQRVQSPVRTAAQGGACVVDARECHGLTIGLTGRPYRCPDRRAGSSPTDR